MSEKKTARIAPVLRAYAKASAKYPGALAAAVLGVIGVQAASVVAPLYLKDFINILSGGSASPALVSALFSTLLVYAALGAGMWVAQRVQSVGLMRMESNVMRDLADDAFASLIRHGYDFFTSNFAGTLTRRVTRYSRSYEQVFDSLIFDFLPTILFAAGSIGILYARNVWLGVALLVWALSFVLIQLFLVRWQHPLRAARVAEDSRLTGAISDVVGNHSAVALFAAEKREEEYIASVSESWRAATWRAWFANSVIQSIQRALAVIVEVGLLAGAVLLWERGVLTIGDFVLIQVYVIGLINRVWNMGNAFRRLSDAFSDASEMTDIIETPYAIQDTPGAEPLALTQGGIGFKDVSFSFIEGRPVFDGFSMRISGGEKAALVGPSGAGKSTLTKLLLRLYDISGGSITIDGQDIRGVTQESVRKAIAFVPQEPALFHRSLRENIRYGRPDATDEEVREAAREAHCLEFIERYPEGFDTLVGERGVKLSGGERQRVAIARAILKDAPILVLDEATSSLDSESEALIQDALAKLMEGKTVIVIAHRLSTIMKMDRIVVMEQGRVALSGTHQELLAQESNLYKKLWEIQAGGFIAG